MLMAINIDDFKNGAKALSHIKLMNSGKQLSVYERPFSVYLCLDEVNDST